MQALPPPFFPLHPNEKITFTANRLPHWEQPGRSYFVTFHMDDSLPQPVLDKLEEEREKWHVHHPRPWSSEVEEEYTRRFVGWVNAALDQGHGSCVLRQPAIAQIVEDALKFFEGERCNQIAWVIMPNHVHTVFTLLEPHRLAELLHSWKSFTAKRINRIINGNGVFWQKDYFDRLIRNEDHLVRCVNYIRENGRKAGLSPEEYRHWELPTV